MIGIKSFPNFVKMKIQRDICNPRLIRLFDNLLKSTVNCNEIGPGRHFTLFPPQGKLACDGYLDYKHEFGIDTGKFRLWKGGSLTFKHPIMVGDLLSLHHEITKVAQKETFRGMGVFTTESRNIYRKSRLVLEEKRDLVYLDRKYKNPVGASTPFLHTANHTTTITPSAIDLFQFSALTFNSHKIHYSDSWARYEGYPGVVVHGPWQVSVLLEFLKDKVGMVKHFEYSNLRPAFADKELTLNLKEMDDKTYLCWILDHTNALVMKGTATMA